MNLKKNYKGILLCLVIAIPCWFLGKKFPIVGGPVFGIILGMIITLLSKIKRLTIRNYFYLKEDFTICSYLTRIWNELICCFTNR